MVGAFPPQIKIHVISPELIKVRQLHEDLLFKYFKLEEKNIKLESRIKELEAQLETLSPGVTRG